jgi:uncharacterized protein YndB with AHSA1/START domain
MADIRIERDVVIEAPMEAVWRTITDPELITQWFADRVELELEPGGQGYMGFGGSHGGPVAVETVDPPNRFSFRWNHPSGEQPIAGNSLLVDFTLSALGPERTHLRVVESGLELLAWPDAEKDRYAEEHNGGWANYLERLAGLFVGRRME